MMLSSKVYKNNSHDKTPKNSKNKIRPANCKIDGLPKPSVKGAVKNHNPRKGTETTFKVFNKFVRCIVKNHNPRKGTETFLNDYGTLILVVVKNHNSRKGTETKVD